MTPEEVREKIDLVNSQVSSIVRGQRILAEIKEELRQNEFAPFEADLILSDHFATSPGEARRHQIGNVIFVTRILHQRGKGLRDIKDADLLYEIAEEKYALIQYKSPNNNGVLKNDIEQLEGIISNCPINCAPWNDRLVSYCGSWYCVRTKDEAWYMEACKAKAIYRGRKTARAANFNGGVSKETFDELFAKCYIGAALSPFDLAYRMWALQDAGHLVFAVLQIGRFLRPR